jgi:hypothetical protein
LIGYRFAVGKISGRWVGFADSDVGAFIFPTISEGHLCGISDRDRAIRLTGAIAQSFEHGYGGVDRWFVGEDLRGKPEDFRCAKCEEIGCVGECEEWFEDEP